MEESYGEGLAIRTGPELCGVSREAGHEAFSRGTCRPGNQPRNQPGWGADAVSLCGRQHPVQRERELGRDPTGSETPGMHGNTSHENREIPGFC